LVTQRLYYRCLLQSASRKLYNVLIVILLVLGGYVQAADSSAQGTTAVNNTQNVGALQVSGPNQIERTVVQIRDRTLSQSREQVLAVEWWPISCRECAASARITEQTQLWNADGGEVPLWSITVGMTYYANALIFSTESVSDLQVLILSD